MPPEWYLETERLVLRRLTPGDAAFMLSIWNDAGFIRHVADRGIRTIEQASAALEVGAFALYEQHGYGPYCMTRKEDSERVGICGLFRRENLDDPDIGFAVLPEFRGIGLAGEAAEAVIIHARDDLALKYLTAIVSPDNAVSIGLIEKLGLQFDRAVTMPGEQQEIRLYGMTLD